jgi:plastocyanin
VKLTTMRRYLQQLKPLRIATVLTALALAACSADGPPIASTGVNVNVNSTGKSTPIPQITMAVQPQVLQPGETATITWTSDETTNCVASGAWTGTQATDNNVGWVTPVLTAPGTYTFTLTCTGPGGIFATSQQVYVGAVAEPTVTFFLEPQSIQPGDSATLTWSTTNTTSCTASGGTGSDKWSGTMPIQNINGFNTGPIPTAGQYSYTLTCSGPGGTGTASQILTVSPTATPAPPTITFNASPLLVLPGGTITFVWNTSNTTSCTASGGTGNDGWSGNQPLNTTGTAIGPINSTGTFTYTLSCTGGGGTSTQSIIILISSNPVPPPIAVDLTINPSTITAGQSAQLSWTSTNASSCVASGSWAGQQPTNGSAVSTGTLAVPGQYSYTLICSGPGGSASSTANLTVNPTTATVNTFAANPTIVQVGQSTTLSWATSGATSCTATGGTGSDGWNGTTQPTSSSGLSIGSFTTAGVYIYTLTCTGPGGPSAPNSVSVTVTQGSSPPLPAITAFVAAPTTVLVGQSTTFTWATVNTDSCTATGGVGNGSDGWTGTQPTSAIAKTVGPFTTAGSYTYTLTCTGPGGTTVTPGTATITVQAATPLPTISTFVALPTTVQVGQSITLTWATLNATSCTASGGTGSDGWDGTTEPTVAAANIVGPLSVTGTFTYTLTCSGPGGMSQPLSVNITVLPAPPGAPSLTFTVNGASSANINPGQSVTIAWSATNAATCVASGGSGSDVWVGALATSNPGQSVGPLNVPGIYTYTLSCTGVGGTSAATVKVTVLPTNAASCGLSQPTTALLSPQSTATGGVRGVCLLGCGVTNLANTTNTNAGDYATMNVAVGVAASAYVRITDSTTTYPAGRQTGFLLVNPSALLSLSLLQNVQVSTLLNGTVQETATVNNLLTLQALGLLANPQEGFVGFTTTKPFNAVEVDLGQLASVLGSVNVYGACVSLQ